MVERSSEDLKKRARAVVRILKKEYPDAKCALRFGNPLELLVATILSAQCTDARVNEVTESLFREYRTAEDYAEADPGAFEEEIRSTGFFRSKAKSILGACRELVEEHDGEVPRTMEALTKLPGVGRKTANVVLGNAFETPAIMVDTHVKRVSGRLGISSNTDPDKIERDLAELIPKKEWTMFSHRMIDHGRAVCVARKPKCPGCALYDVCLYDAKTE